MTTRDDGLARRGHRARQLHLDGGHADLLAAGGLAAHGHVLADGEDHDVALARELDRAVDAADELLVDGRRGLAQHGEALFLQALAQRDGAVRALGELPGAQLVLAVGAGADQRDLCALAQRQRAVVLEEDGRTPAPGGARPPGCAGAR